MAQDSMRVIMYKILRYLYECDRKGKHPRKEDFCHDCQMFHIPERYWFSVMEELLSKGYIKGFSVIRTKSGGIIQMHDNAGITCDGSEFLEDNSGMRKAADFVGNAFSVVLDGIISALV